MRYATCDDAANQVSERGSRDGRCAVLAKQNRSSTSVIPSSSAHEARRDDLKLGPCSSVSQAEATLSTTTSILPKVPQILVQLTLRYRYPEMMNRQRLWTPQARNGI